MAEAMETQELDPSAYHELSAYTLSLRDSAFIHQYVVDAYAAQQASRDTKPITITFALIGLYLHLERGYSGKAVQLAHMRYVRKRRQWPTFELPENRGEVTAANVLRAAPGPEREEAIRKWCRSVWDAWGNSHAQVAELVRELGDW